MLEYTLVFDIGFIIITSTVLALAAKYLKQPLLIGYILAGVLIGPQVLGIVQSNEIIMGLAELGIAFLLFLVGLKLDLSKLSETSGVIIAAAITQILLTFSLGFFIAFALGFLPLISIYIGLILTFSGTSIVVKLLSDNNEINTLHGRIMLGILLIQDIVAVIVLSILGTLNKLSFNIFAIALLQGLGLLAFAMVLNRFVWPKFLSTIEDSSDLIFLFSISLLFIFCFLTIETGFSIAVGGFLAGISIAVFPYNIEIAERAKSLRDFFVTIFFVSLGMLVRFHDIFSYIVPIIIFLGVVIIFKPLMIDLVIKLFGYQHRTAFLSGMGLGQISEFSLILALLGLRMVHIMPEIFSITALLMLTTIITTSYFIKYDRKIYNILKDYMGSSGHARKFFLDNPPQEGLRNHIIIFGAHDKGYRLIRNLKGTDEGFVAVDYNPEVIKRLAEWKVQCVYGDIIHPEVLERVNLEDARIVISTVPDKEDNLFIIDRTRELNPKAKVFVTANNLDDALKFYDEGADYVIYPKLLAGNELAKVVENVVLKRKSIDNVRKKSLKELEHKKEEEIIYTYGSEFLKNIRRRIKGG